MKTFTNWKHLSRFCCVEFGYKNELHKSESSQADLSRCSDQTTLTLEKIVRTPKTADTDEKSTQNSRNAFIWPKRNVFVLILVVFVSHSTECTQRRMYDPTTKRKKKTVRPKKWNVCVRFLGTKSQLRATDDFSIIRSSRLCLRTNQDECGGKELPKNEWTKKRLNGNRCERGMKKKYDEDDVSHTATTVTIMMRWVCEWMCLAAMQSVTMVYAFFWGEKYP